MKKIYLLLFLLIPFNVYAHEASNISSDSTYKLNDNTINKLTDINVKTSITVKPDDAITITSNDQNISHIYIMYNTASKNGNVITDNEEQELGVNGFLHEYVKLSVPCNKITLTFNEEAKIDELYVYSEGDIPKDVQVWKIEDKTDLMIFSTHADDEQLFFSGVMPTYINQGKKVHVVYLARHDIGSYYSPNRLHEQLDGLWTLGVTDYPTFGLIPDAYSTSLDVAESQLVKAGFTDEDIIKFDVREIRKYQPKVILGHDEKGEYGHGQHQLNSFTLKQAITKSNDENYIVDDLKPYTIPKVYLHLYNPQNYTILDYDIPLENYDNKTAYEVSKEGYSKHLSQQYTWFTGWLNGKSSKYTSAKQIATYSPMYWGLYYTNVGDDVNKNDLFENIPIEKEEIKKKKEAVITKKAKYTFVEKLSNFVNMFSIYINYIIGGIAITGSLIFLIVYKKKRTTK